MPRVQSIIVNYRGAADTVECLDSLAAQIGVTCLPLVVDNASGDDSVALIRAAHPGTEIVVTEENLGFAGGNNVGIRHALSRPDSDYLFLVNNDTAMEPDCLQRLVRCAQAHPDAAVITPAIYWYDDHVRPWFTGSTMDETRGTADHVLSGLPGGRETAPFEIPWASGCAMLIPRPRMAELHGFDERFFCYWEDVDLSLRARTLGHVCLLCPAAVLYHKVSATARNIRFDAQYYAVRNQMLCFSISAPWRHRPRLLWLRTRDALRARDYWRRDNTEHGRRMANASVAGAVDFFRRRFGRCTYDWEA